MATARTSASLSLGATRHGRHIYSFGPIALALFLQAGTFKAYFAVIPVDLTALLAGIVTLCVIAALVRAHFRIPRKVIPLLCLFLALAPAALWTSYTDYGIRKVSTLFTFGLLAALAPLFLFRSDRDLRHFYWTLTAIGCVTAAQATWFPAGAADPSSRLTSQGGGPIALGHLVVVAVLWITFLTTHKRIRPVVSLPLLSALLYVAISTGSRGPLVAGVFAVILSFVVNTQTNKFRAATLLAALAAVTWYIFPAAPEYARGRLAELNPTRELRFDAWRDALSEVGDNPFGIGWGDFGLELPQYAFLEYPHNLLLEVALEGGWFAALALVLFCLRVLSRASADAAGLEGQASFALATFATAAAMVSGDIAGNRMVLALYGVLLARERWSARPSPSNRAHPTESGSSVTPAPHA